ncbi:MAG: gamma carbonic anhydrase family protein [Deltaproteobacteria bacterium]|nr:gamma carbonic anhydrase family protein [Deltaproteobacteria bacterium]
MPIYEFEGKRPSIGKYAFVHPCAILIGGVTIGENCYIGPGAVLRADFGEIEIQSGSNVQENAVFHVFPDQIAHLGKNSLIAHGAIVHGSDIGEKVLVGMGAIIHEQVTIGNGCMIGSSCVITQGQIIPPGKLVVGIPGRIVSDVTQEMIRSIENGIRIYHDLPRRYLNTMKLVDINDC